jgi:hypothetical protein
VALSTPGAYAGNRGGLGGCGYGYLGWDRVSRRLHSRLRGSHALK